MISLSPLAGTLSRSHLSTPQQLCDGFGACPTLRPVYRRLVKLALEELRMITDHIDQLDQQMADSLMPHEGPDCSAALPSTDVCPRLVSSGARLEAEVLGTSTLSESPNTEVIPNQLLTSADGAKDCRFVVHRSPIGARLLVRLTHKRSNLHWNFGLPAVARSSGEAPLRQGYGGNLRVGARIEPGMEVLQISPGSLSC